MSGRALVYGPFIKRESFVSSYALRMTKSATGVARSRQRRAVSVTVYRFPDGFPPAGFQVIQSLGLSAANYR
jgi:hypothetical protein